jgi:hypothetical protein
MSTIQELSASLSRESAAGGQVAVTTGVPPAVQPNRAPAAA